MTDNQIPNEPTQEEASTSGEKLRNISKRLNDVMGLLRSQQDILRQRGINLPSGAMDNLRTLKKRMDTLTRAVIDSQQELTSLRALAETSALINSGQNTEDVLNQVMDTVIALTGAERGYIVLKNQQTGELEFKVARGMDQSALDSSKGTIVSTTIVNNVADTGVPVLTDNASQDERYQAQESVVGFQLRSILAVPLKSREEVIGVVYCDNRFMSGLFKQHELDVLTSFANQAAVAIENARLFESVRMRLEEVTEIRDRMQNLFDSITSGVVTVDENGDILISNEAAHTIIHQQQLEGQKLHQALPAVDEAFYALLEEVRDKGTQHTEDFETLVDGRPRYWTVIASPLRDDNGSHGITMVIDDLTEQRHSELQVRETLRYVPPALIDNLRGVDINEVGSEEREVTALFADIRGFTTFSENLEPEELMTIINKYLSLASDAISFGEGIVDKYMGDAVTGLFNTQLNPQRDHPGRAIQTALHLVRDMFAMHEVLPESERVYYGLGVHTGPAVLGNVGGKDRKEFSALGEAMDVSKFLQEQAGPGEVIISEDTYNLVRDDFECEELSELARPKEGYEHIKCYRVVKPKKPMSLFLDDELRKLLEMEDFANLLEDD